MKPLEAYLWAATRGLWGRKRLEVRKELTAHVLERAHKHEVAGVNIDNQKHSVTPIIGEFVQVANLVQAMLDAGGKLHLAGWDNPEIRYGGIKFTLGSKEKPVLGQNIFKSLLCPYLNNLLVGWTTENLRVSDAPGYMEEQQQAFGRQITTAPQNAITQCKSVKLTRTGQPQRHKNCGRLCQTCGKFRSITAWSKVTEP
jgi:hypothetical protein